MIYTIGHSTRSQFEVFHLLAENEVDELIDVRSYPSSKHCPQWNQIEIINGISRGIPYEWMRELGGKRKALPIDQSINGAWRNTSFRGYADYMQSADFNRALDALVYRASTVPNVAIMCSEAVWWKCHRSMIADALVARDIEVRHIMASGQRPVSHILRDFAVVSESHTVSYPA